MSALFTALSPLNLIYMLVGTVLGILIGAAPGLGPVFALAILLPMTYSMSATSSVIFLSAVYGACCYGGSISAILLNTPGTPGNVATCFDGYPMTRRGEAGRALGISTMASLVGGLFGVAAFALLGNALAQLSLKIGAAEYFLLAVAGLCLVALAAKGNVLKGIIMGGLGLMLTFIGRSVVTGDKRFTFGTVYLEDGLQFIPIVIGAFALAQALILVNEKGAMRAADSKVSGVMAGTREVFKFPVPLIRSSVLGTIIGIVPGLGINAASFITYVVEKNAAKDKDTFGEGNTKGLIAPQTAIGAVTSSALIPAFALGVPGSSSAALFLSALSIHGIQTGYSFYSKNGDMVSTIIWGMLLAQFAFAGLGLLGAKYFAKITEMPNSLLVPLILMLSVVGAYATRRQIMDVAVMLAAAVIGYCLERNKFPLSCLVLGLILGSLAEDNYCRAMRLSGNSWSIFVTRPISLVLMIVIVVCFAWPFLKKAFVKKKAEL